MGILTTKTELAEQPATGDLLHIVDISDTTDDATGTSKKVTRDNLIGSVLAATTASFTTADETKLDGIEASADVTDTANVTAAGALMDSEVTNLADVKAFDTTDYATAAQGATADSAQQPPSEGAFANGDKTKLDGIEASADVTDTANVTSAGALMDSELTDITAVKALADADVSTTNTGTSTTAFVTPDGLAGSNYGIRYVSAVLNGTTALTTDDKAYLRIPSAYNGWNLVSVAASVGTGAAGSSSSGTPTFTVRNVTDAAQMLSTSLTVDANEYTSATAAAAAVIDTGADDLATDDLIEIACTTAGTGVTYATITLGLRLP